MEDDGLYLISSNLRAHGSARPRCTTTDTTYTPSPRARRRRFPSGTVYQWRARARGRAALLRDARRFRAGAGGGCVNPSCRAHIALLVADVTARTGAGRPRAQRFSNGQAATARSTGRLPFRYFMASGGAARSRRVRGGPFGFNGGRKWGWMDGRGRRRRRRSSELASDQCGCNVRVVWLVGPVTYELDHPQGPMIHHRFSLVSIRIR